MRKAAFRKINPNLVKRLQVLLAKDEKRQVPQVKKFLARLKNIDHRDWLKNNPAPTTSPYGYRVRALTVSRNYPEIGEIAVKRTHTASAPAEIRIISSIVRKHNKIVKKASYVLKTIKPEALGQKLILMRRLDFPTIKEILGSTTSRNRVTERGRQFFARLNKMHRVSKKDLERAFIELERNMAYVRSIADSKGELLEWRFSRDQFFLAGFEKGKFVFVPVIDLR